MLVLTRKSNQSIMIGDDIEVSVLSVMGEKVRIGIQAPQKVPVFRKEIYLEIHREAGVPKPDQDATSAQPQSSDGSGKTAGHTAAAEADHPLHELGESS
jgi:carbon storage regulator